jgi:hypothetical protein
MICTICHDTGYKGIFHPRTLELTVVKCNCQKPISSLQNYILRLQNAQYARENGIKIPEGYLK